MTYSCSLVGPNKHHPVLHLKASNANDVSSATVPLHIWDELMRTSQSHQFCPCRNVRITLCAVQSCEPSPEVLGFSDWVKMHRSTWVVIQPYVQPLPTPLRKVVMAFGESRATASEAALRYGFASRFQLSRSLRRAGLPSFHQLGAWIVVLDWLFMCDCDCDTVPGIAARIGREPASCYRLVKATTGLTWTELRKAGTSRAVVRFTEACRPRGRSENDFHGASACSAHSMAPAVGDRSADWHSWLQESSAFDIEWKR